MKKVFTLLLVFSFCLLGIAQNIAPIKPELNLAKKSNNIKFLGDEAITSLINNQPITSAAASWPGEAIIGFTSYDLQTNNSIQDRIFLNDQGNISAVWTMSNDASAGTVFPDRGTGYNFYDPSPNGNQIVGWNSFPNSRIESERCGWPNLLLIENTENIIAHNTQSSNLLFNTRNTVGSGSWTENILTSDEIVWNRSCVGGSNGKTIHMIGVINPSTTAGTGIGYQGLDGALVYWRSIDGGLTWDIQNYLDPATDSTTTTGYGGDSYAIACKGDTVSWVYFGNWGDTFLMQSFDNGQSWDKTIIWNFPIDMYEADMGSDINGDGISDTLATSDGSGSIILDNNGDPHVFFGNMNVLDADLTDESSSYFPGTNGISYWNKTMMEADSSFNEYASYTVDGNELNSLEFMMDTTFSFSWDSLAMAYDTVANSSMQIIFYNDSVNPAIATDTLNAWTTSEITDSLGVVSVNVLGPDSSITLSYTTVWSYFNSGKPVTITGAPDMDGDSVITAFGTDGIPVYGLGLSSMPHSTCDDDGNIFLVYSAHMELLSGFSGSTAPDQNYRHIFIMKSEDGGVTWSEPVDLTANISDQECVYPTISKTSNDRLHIIYQRDFYPGLAVSGDLDPVELNEIVYIDPLKSDFTYSQMGIQEEHTTSVFQNYPNPATTLTSFVINIEKSTNATITISNTLGQVIITQFENLKSGNNKITLDVSNLEAGIYFYTTSFNGSSITKRMIVN